MSKFINPDTGQPQEDRLGIVAEDSLEKKVAYAIAKLNQSHKLTSQRVEDAIAAIKTSHAQIKENIALIKETLEQDIQDVKAIQKENIDSFKEMNDKEHRQLLSAIRNLRADTVERYEILNRNLDGCIDVDDKLEKRIADVEQAPDKRLAENTRKIIWVAIGVIIPLIITTVAGFIL